MPTGISISTAILGQKAGLSTPPFNNSYSMMFDGVNDYLVGSSVPLLGAGGTGNWSISFWFKAPTIAKGSNQRLFAFGAEGTTQTQMYITSAGSLQFQGPWSDGYNFWGVNNTWYHVVYRADTAGTIANVGYVVDGTNYNNKNQTVTTVFDTTGNAYLGRNAGSYGFDGFIDEFAVWDKYLSDADCIEIYNAGVPNNLTNVAASANLKHWWRMGDPGGQSEFPTIVDGAGAINMTMTNMLATNITTDTP